MVPYLCTVAGPGVYQLMCGIPVRKGINYIEGYQGRSSPKVSYWPVLLRKQKQHTIFAQL